MCITVLFAMEIVFKMLAFTICGFWQSRRNRIDLLITVIGLIWCVIHSLAVGVIEMGHFRHLIAARHRGERHRSNTEEVHVQNGLPDRRQPLFYARRPACEFNCYPIATIASLQSTLKMLMLTVVMSVFRSFFIIVAMFLLMLFYAYTGVILFGTVKYGQALTR